MVPVGSVDDRPDYAYADGVTLRAYEFPRQRPSLTVTVPDLTGEVAAVFEVTRDGRTLLTASSAAGDSTGGRSSGCTDDSGPG